MTDNKTDRKIGMVIVVLILMAVIASGTTMFINWQKVRAAETDGISHGCQMCLEDHKITVTIENARLAYQNSNNLRFVKVKEDCRCNCTNLC